MFEFDSSKILQNPKYERLDFLAERYGFYSAFLVHDEGLPTVTAGVYFLLSDKKGYLEKHGFAVNFLGDVVLEGFEDERYCGVTFPDFAFFKLDPNQPDAVILKIEQRLTAIHAYRQRLNRFGLGDFFTIGITERDLQNEALKRGLSTKDPGSVHLYTGIVCGIREYREDLLRGYELSWAGFMASVFYDWGLTDEQNRERFRRGKRNQLFSPSGVVRTWSHFSCEIEAEYDIDFEMRRRWPFIVYQKLYYDRNGNKHYSVYGEEPGQNIGRVAYYFDPQYNTILAHACFGIYEIMKRQLPDPYISDVRNIGELNEYGFCVFEDSVGRDIRGVKMLPGGEGHFHNSEDSGSFFVPMRYAAAMEFLLKASAAQQLLGVNNTNIHLGDEFYYQFGLEPPTEGSWS